MISPRPRQIYRSAELNCPPGLQAGLDTVTEKLKQGEDVKPHLHTRIATDPDYYDGLLDDWGIHHLHLGTKVWKDGFMARTNEVLFVRVTDDAAYVLQVLPHKNAIDPDLGNWVNSELLKIIHRNWPDSIARYRFPTGIRLAQSISDRDRQRARPYVALPTEVDGVVFMPLGGGATTAGVGVETVEICDQITHGIVSYQATVTGEIRQFTDQITLRGTAVPDPLIIRLRMDGDQNLHAVEPQSGVSMKLGTFLI